MIGGLLQIKMKILIFFVHFTTFTCVSYGFPEQGVWDFNITGEGTVSKTVSKSLYEGCKIFIHIDCNPFSHDANIPINILWRVTESTCFNTDRPSTSVSDNATEICGKKIMLKEKKISEGKGPPMTVKKDEAMLLTGDTKNVEGRQKVRRDAEEKNTQITSQSGLVTPVFTVPKDGFYSLILQISGSGFTAPVRVEMKGDYGYLSAANWPLLPFYGIMCLVYVTFGVAWLLVSFCQWRDLLRIQFWIGGVILLGMLEKATFYAEYQNINSTGVSMKGAVLLAECVSCGKRTLARMLVIIVSLGFGIVKPRLGPMLHRVVGVGACYFILAVVESYIRVMNPKSDSTKQLLIASIPLAALDSIICWWIFTSLVQTTRTLRLRRNLVKLNLYRHFTNTLIFAVLASIIFMLYSIKAHHLAPCLTDWKELWADEAYWHILFSVLLLVIMILWRPTNNNQRYAFTPLLDAADDDEEEDQFVNDAYGVKMRTHSRASSPKPKSSNDDDPLKWVDENIPSAVVDTALPILDSEEEILTTKFEVSKMQ